MACGLPVITSSAAGVSEIIHSGEDGFVLEQPEDFMTLSDILRRLKENPSLRDAIAEKASATARDLTWENTAAHIRAAWEQARRGRISVSGDIIAPPEANNLPQESEMRYCR